MKESIVVLRHSPATFPYNFEARAGSPRIETASFAVGPEPREPGACGSVIVSGGMMSANDEGRLPWLRKELAWIERVLAAGVPYLGICLGAQLLAKVAGAPVGPVGKYELGYRRVSLTDYGARNPVLGALPRVFTAFQWHGEGFALPAGATLLATASPPGGDTASEWPNQAFALGDLALGLQFHLEFAAAHVASMVEEEREAWPSGPLVHPPARVLADAALSEECAENMRLVLEGFLALRRGARTA